MPRHYRWDHLTHLQVGQYAEYYFKMEFVLLGMDVYSAEVDDRGIDFVVRQAPNKYWDVQVKSIRNPRGYVFFPKIKFLIRPNLLAAVALFREEQKPDLFLIPSVRWKLKDSVFVDRDYKDKKSKPEYGINLSEKNIEALEEYRFDDAAVKTFGAL